MRLRRAAERSPSSPPSNCLNQVVAPLIPQRPFGESFDIPFLLVLGAKRNIRHPPSRYRDDLLRRPALIKGPASAGASGGKAEDGCQNLGRIILFRGMLSFEASDCLWKSVKGLSRPLKFALDDL